MWKKSILILIVLIIVPIAIAGNDYFYIKSTGSPYEVVPGEEFVIDFVLFNKDVEAPKNVTAYIDPCPYGWECESKVFSYDRQADHPENLSVKVYDNALPKRETLYIRLESYWPTTRGDDRVLVTVVDSKVKPISYEEYKEKEEEKEEPTGVYVPASQSGAEIVEVKKADPVEIEEALSEPETDEDIQIPEDEKEEEPEPQKVSEKIERLESDRGFMEYATVVLVILLAVTGIGALIAWKKKK